MCLSSMPFVPHHQSPPQHRHCQHYTAGLSSNIRTSLERAGSENGHKINNNVLISVIVHSTIRVGDNVLQGANIADLELDFQDTLTEDDMISPLPFSTRRPHLDTKRSRK